MVNATFVETIERKIGEYDLQAVGISAGYKRTGEVDAALQKEALDYAVEADVVLYFFGLDEISESEGLDRNHMRIPQNQIDLLNRLAQVNQNIVGVLSAGSAVEMPWQTNLKGILHGYLTGQAGAGANVDRKSTRLNSSHSAKSRMPSSA